MAEGVKNTGFNIFLLFYYNQVLGLSGTLSGAAIFAALCVDAITDPLMGSISDNFRSRLGRRHPFMYMAALPMAAAFYLLFNPPHGAGQLQLFAWLTVFAVGVRVSMTLYTIPSAAMLPEITTNYDERTTLVSYRFLFGWLGGLTCAQLGYLYFFAPSSQFTDGRLDPDAYGTFALSCAVLIAAAILLCTVGTQRLIPSLRVPREQATVSVRRLLADLRTVFANRTYVVLLFAALFAAVARGFNDVVWLYMNTYFWGLSTAEIAVLMYALVVAAVAAFTFAQPITRRFDKKPAALGLAIFATVFGSLPVMLRLVGLMPDNASPALLPLLFIHLVCLMAAVVTITIIFASMIADVTDDHELATGKRQEGMFMSVVAFTDKATSGIGGLLAGIALDVIGFPTGAAQGAVPPDTVYQLGLAVGPGLIGLYICSVIFLSRYHLTREQHGVVLAALATREARREHARAYGTNS